MEDTLQPKNGRFLKESYYYTFTITMMGGMFVLLEHFFPMTNNEPLGSYPFAFIAFLLLLTNYSSDQIVENGLKRQILMGANIAFIAFLIHFIVSGLTALIGLATFEKYNLKDASSTFSGLFLATTFLCIVFNWVADSRFGIAVKAKWQYISELKWLNYILASIVLGGGLFIGVYAYLLRN